MSGERGPGRAGRRPRKGETFQLGSGSVTVTDVLQGKQLADLNGGHYVLAPLALAQNITGRQGQLDSILITTKPGADLATVRAGVTSAVNGRAIVADPSMRAARAGDGVKMMNYMALMGAVVALVVGAFLIYTTMTMAITQRRPVISMLRAIGGRRVTIVRDMLAEAAILGLIGGAIGSGVGILLGRIAIGRLPPAVTQGLEARVEYWLPGYAVPAALAATVITSVVASAMAARQVYKVSPIQALARRGISSGFRATMAADRMRRWRRHGIRGVDPDRRWPNRHHRRCCDVCFVLCRDRAWLRAHHAHRQGHSRGGSNVRIGWATRRRDDRTCAAASVGHVMTVLIAVVTTVVITGTNADMIRSARGIFAPVADVDVWVSADPPDSYPTDVLPQGLAQKVAAVRGVAHVTEGAFGFAVVGGTRVMLDGFSSGTADPFYRALDEQVRNEVLAGRGVVLSQNLGKTLHVRVGDQLRLQTPHGLQQTTVLALVPYFSTVIGTVGIDLDQMRAWFDRPVATTLEIAGGRRRGPEAPVG